MEDTIYREDAIKALRERWARTTSYDGIGEDIGEECEDVIKTIPSAERPQGWIPCSERMPSENGKYLCCWQGKSVETGMFLNGHFRLYGEIKDNLVTAWMPLPKPWKGADDDRWIDAEWLLNKYKGHHDFYLNAWDGDFKSMDAKDKARCDELTNCIAEIVNAPTITTKQVKYYDEEEQAWKIGEVIVNSSEKPNNSEIPTGSERVGKYPYNCNWDE